MPALWPAYFGSLVYQRTSGALSLESASFGDGRIIKTSSTYSPNYFVTDHLGSTRVVINDGSSFPRQDYYPFGMAWTNPSMQTGTNRYLYNGKEKQTTGELNYLDYGARMYDWRLVRWFNIDPLAELNRSNSLYIFVSNNPIRRIDRDGRLDTDYEIDQKTGLIVRTSSVDDKPDRLFGKNLSTGKMDMIIVHDKSILANLEHKAGPNILNDHYMKTEKYTNPETGKSGYRFAQVSGYAATTSNKKEAMNVFEFAASSSNVEWGIAGSKTGMWAVGTLNANDQAPSFVSLSDDFSIVNMTFKGHSHSGSDSQIDFLPSSYDINSADRIRSRSPGAEVKLFRPQYPNAKEKWIHIR